MNTAAQQNEKRCHKPCFRPGSLGRARLRKRPSIAGSLFSPWLLIDFILPEYLPLAAGGDSESGSSKLGAADPTALRQRSLWAPRLPALLSDLLQGGETASVPGQSRS